jgi:glycine/D-amino acid oxidase-like deaminating enzyme/nitrite reductase/ring-hydroxylating ferredoxin subunit
MDAARSRSLWMATSDAVHYAPLGGDMRADVCIVGAGITGLTAAYLLARDGLRVVVLERRTVASGTTGHSTAKVTALQGLTYSRLRARRGDDAARDYAAAQLAAQSALASIAEVEGIDCDLRRLPAFLWTGDPGQLDALRAELEASQEAGLPTAWTDDTPLPWPVAGAIRLDHQVAIHPSRYCAGLAERAAGFGARIHEGTAAHAVKRNGSGAVVETDRGRVRADAAILATLMPFHDPSLLAARATPSRSYALAAQVEGELPEGLFLDVERPHRSLRPYRPGSGIARLVVEGEEHRPGTGGRSSRHVEAIEAWARTRFRIRSIEHRWSAQDYMTPDGMPFIGPLTPGSRAVLTAAGFNKWGMTNGTLGGMILADLVRLGDHPWLARFSTLRLFGPAGLVDIARHNAEVAVAFVGGRLPGGRGLDDIAPGHGAVIGHGRGKAAVFRDQDGSLRALSARCTHLGCLVAFNDAEGSWDCACHGSRFDTHGRVIEGPATRPLEPVDLG